MSKIKIIAAIVDTQQLTLYKEDGSTIVILQGDPRLARIVTEATPALARNEVAEVSLETEVVNHYQQFEEKSNGLIKLFRIAKSKLQSFFDASSTIVPKEVLPQILGKLPQAEQPIMVLEPEPTGTKEEQFNAAVADIMAHAVPVASPQFMEEEVGGDSDNTVVAVMEQVGQQTAIISAVEHIAPQMAYANNSGSTVGMENFMKRMASVVNKRRHSVEDLMKFMQKGDLPVAEDGSIIIYKVLNHKFNSKDTFVDCHTRLVPQKVGSYVCMDESLVDHDNTVECSNGLHVARRGYVGTFSGDVCVLAKVAPEDVIAVPKDDANKMRVCGYHILFKLSAEDFYKLKNNRPITDTVEGQKLLAAAMAGNHVGILEEVRIGGHSGTNIKVTPMGTVTEPVEEKPTTLAKAIEEEVPMSAPSVEPKAVAAAAAQVVEEAKPAETVAAKPAGNVRQQKAVALWNIAEHGKTDLEQTQASKDLLAFKKASKVSWETLGLDASVGHFLQKKLS